MKKVFLILPVLLLLVLPVFILAQTSLININTAGAKELNEGITGVGEVIANRIIEYRNVNGPFKTIEEIKNVSGIGDATFLEMKDEITIGSDSSVSDNSDPDEATSDQSIDSDDDSNLEESSAHTGETTVSDYQKESLKIGAGRERLATVRTPILFSATQNKKGQNINYLTWSFGDGTSALGAKVYHTYQFPGRYNVVLNASIDNEEEAVARTTVLVTEAKVNITAIDLAAGFVEITNNSDKEQNLNSWSLLSGSKKYVFPLDTIISPKSVIKVPLSVIGLAGQDVKEIFLTYPDGGVVSSMSLLSVENQQKVAELKKRVVALKQQIASRFPGPLSQGTEINQGSVSTKTALAREAESVVVLSKELSWFGRIKNAIFK